MLTKNFKLTICFFLITFSVYLFGCAAASTTITDFTNPDYKGEKVKKVMVFLLLNDLQMREEVENSIIETVSETGYKFVSSLTLFSPVKSYSGEEVKDILKMNNIDGLCIISIMDISNEQVYVPETKFYETEGKGKLLNDYFNYKSKTTVSTFGGYYMNRPAAKVETALFATTSEEMIWYAQSTTYGNGYAGVNTMASSYASELVERLQKKKLIK